MKNAYRKICYVEFGVIINLLGCYLAYVLHMPFWGDMIGTCVATYFGGLWCGIITVLLAGFITGLYNLSLLNVVAGFGLAIGFYFVVKKNLFQKLLHAMLVSFWLGILCVMISTPINLVLYEGYCGNEWGDALVDMLRWYDISNIVSAYAGAVIVELVDKQICIISAFYIILFAKKILKNDNKVKTVVSVLLLVCIGTTLIGFPLQTIAAPSASFGDNYIETIYDNKNGMVSSEANAICETEDGHIWVGSYAGLNRYNGQEFEFIREGGIVSVIDMMRDSQNRLWIGTNDAGIARYENGAFAYFTKEDGLISDSVRCFAEDGEGNIYVGTSDKICVFRADDRIEVLDYDISFVKEMAVYKDLLIAIDNNGKLYLITERKIYSLEDEIAKQCFCQCIAVSSKGLLAGTDEGEVLMLDVSENGIKLNKVMNLTADSVASIFEDRNGRVWVAASPKSGYFDANGVFHIIKCDGFDEFISCIYEDYQGNIWGASSHYGVIKLSQSNFVNVFERAGQEARVVNASVVYAGDYYFGTDNGLVILNQNSLQQVNNEITKRLEGIRIRSLFIDSHENLWICTYKGLLCYNKENDFHLYDVLTQNTSSDRFRCITELNDETIVAGTADGINYIKGGKVVNVLNADDGMQNTQILTLAEAGDGILLAGSDGSGIYVIENGVITNTLTKENGLSSGVVLRLIPCEHGFLVVTSNSLCHMSENYKITKLTSFPYFNNYDIIVEGQMAYVTCSAGVYKVKLGDLCANKVTQYELYDVNEGLGVGLTANSWNDRTQAGELLLCSNSGCVLFHDNETDASANQNIKYGLSYVEADGECIQQGNTGDYLIPARAEKIQIYASVRNYACVDMKVRFFLEGENDNDNGKIYHWNEIEPIQIVKPEKKEYRIKFQILDSLAQNLLSEKEIVLKRDIRLWERPGFITYLILVCLELFFFAIVNVVSMVNLFMRKNELEILRVELDEKVKNKTEELVLQQNKTKELFVQTVTALSEAVDAKDRYTSGHSKRVAEYAAMIAAKMGKSKEEQEEIYRAGLLHDVGKIRVPEDIINKPGKLTEQEFDIIKIHPDTGYHILKWISGSEKIALGTKYHHERYDGKGYPHGLAGENIPEIARILCVADSYDAMASNRSYRKALPQETVRNEIIRGRGTQFDPAIADVMLQMIDEDKEYKLQQSDLSGRKILVVDDEPMNVKFVRNILRDEPRFEIIGASGGKEALQILEETEIDLILLDVIMPEMNGLETLKQIRMKHQIAVALMTADKELTASSEFKELGCDDFITKPFMPLLLIEVIRNMCD